MTTDTQDAQTIKSVEIVEGHTSGVKSIYRDGDEVVVNVESHEGYVDGAYPISIGRFPILEAEGGRDEAVSNALLFMYAASNQRALIELHEEKEALEAERDELARNLYDAVSWLENGKPHVEENEGMWAENVPAIIQRCRRLIAESAPYLVYAERQQGAEASEE